MPAPESVPPRFARSAMNAFFVCDMTSYLDAIINMRGPAIVASALRPRRMIKVATLQRGLHWKGFGRPRRRFGIDGLAAQLRRGLRTGWSLPASRCKARSATSRAAC